MKILALDSSGLVASVAVIEDNTLLAEYTVNYKKTHSQTLLPMLDEVVRMIDLDLHTIDAIAIAYGPGSFTGLRIGCATVKGLGFALDKPIIEVPTLDALAYNLYGVKEYICPIMDARRNQVYTGVYTFTQGKLTVIREQWAENIEALAELLNEMNQPIIFLGDGVPVYEDKLKECMKAHYSFAPAHTNRQRAASVGTLAYNLFKAGAGVSAKSHTPIYLRLSQAERELAEKEDKKL